jgi:tartrate dehydratase alpha subunit/fumarate hydratase class I-like protein
MISSPALCDSLLDRDGRDIHAAENRLHRLHHKWNGASIGALGGTVGLSREACILPCKLCRQPRHAASSLVGVALPTTARSADGA